MQKLMNLAEMKNKQFLMALGVGVAYLCGKYLTGRYFHRQLASMPFEQLCLYHKHLVQVHYIATQDGYVLKYFRIAGKNMKFAPGKPVILMQHGLLDSADSWIINDEHLSCAFFFANRNFDVWLANSRGNKHCLTHCSLSY